MPSTPNTHVIYNVGLAVRLLVLYCEDLMMVMLKIAVSMWCNITGKVAADISKDFNAFIFGSGSPKRLLYPNMKIKLFTISGTTCSTTQQHIPEDCNSKIPCSYVKYSCPCAHHKGILGSRGIAPPFLNLGNRWIVKWSASSPDHFYPKG